MLAVMMSDSREVSVAQGRVIGGRNMAVVFAGLGDEDGGGGREASASLDSAPNP